ncbi:MAG: hypothetical protein HKO59_09580 [Phycisphaerales bacterium]|nr:hypothetical protein [Phycisphaerales bacterium]NNM26216.1 hypothetical protein [Phycisphaerales bacterium]
MDGEIRRTECMTFPRSGHGLLQKLLTAYFGEERLGYCESYGNPHAMFEFDPRTRFQKNHDLDLATPRDQPDRQYLVQIRYPIESLVSWFTLACETNDRTDAAASWINFAFEKTAFWMRFYRKWVLDPLPDRLVVNYADLVDDPVTTLADVIEFLGEDAPDRERVASVCERVGIARRNAIRAFKYYGPDFFQLLEGFYAAVPGVDVRAGTLRVPSPEPKGACIETGAVVSELWRVSKALETLAADLNHADLARVGGPEAVAAPLA